MSRILLTIIIFFSRGCVTGIFQAAYIYTPDIYPIPLRPYGVATSSNMARFGAMITPYISQVLLPSYPTSAAIVYMVAAMSAAVGCLILPKDYKVNDIERRHIVK